MSDADRSAEIEKKLDRLRTEMLTADQRVAELRLDMRRIEEKIDTILLKLLAPERLEQVYEDYAGTLKVDTPEDITDLMANFLARRAR